MEDTSEERKQLTVIGDASVGETDVVEAKGPEQHQRLFGMSAQGDGDVAAPESMQIDTDIVPGTSASSDAVTKETSTIVPASEIQHPTNAESVARDDVEELKRQKIQLEQDLFIANEQQSSLQTKVAKLNELLESQKKEFELFGKDRSQRMAVLRELEAERDQLMLSKNESEQRAEILLRQKEDLEASVNRLTHHKNLLTAEVQSSKSEIEKLIQKNIVVEAKLDEIKKDRRLFEFEKERWAQEKEIYLHNKEWFMNEIKERDTKLSVLKIESLRLAGELQAEKASLSEECESLKNELNNFKAQLTQRDEQIDSLNRRMKEVLEDRSAKLNKLEEELLTSERLIAVYKEASEDAERNLRELSSEYDDRGKLLDEAKQEYQALRLRFDEKHSSFEEELQQKNAEIKELTDELGKANELLKSKHRLSLTDEEVSELSPSAAAASALIKSGVSLTAIYREHSRVVAELEASKAEIARLEQYIKEFVEELEKKAPLLAHQRSEYERLNELCSALRLQLQSAEEERQRLVSVRDSAARELAYTKAELERTQRDNDDLSKQVCHLLHASEVNKAWSARDSDSPPMSDEDRDVLWTSIGELQKANQKLMSDLRSVKANHQQIIQEANQAEINRLSEALDEAVKNLDILKEKGSTQNLIIEKLEEQRDTYKRLVEEKKPDEASTDVAKELENARDLVKQLQSQVERSEKCLEIYQGEKVRSDKILQDRIDQQFALIAELRKTNGKLEADIEIQRQTQQALTKQTECDATELDLAREKLAKLGSDKKTLEERLRNTECQLFESRAEVAKYKTDVSSMNEQIASLRSSEARLHQELFIVRESNYSNEKMAATLQQLQVRLERSEDEKAKQIEDQLNVTRNENEALKNFVSEITEQHRIVSQDLKMTSNKIKTERDQALASKKSVEDCLKWKENEFAELQAKYDTLIKQLNSSDSSLDTTAEGCRKEAQQLRNRNVYLENQLNDVRTNLEAVEKKLAIREKEIEEITKLSGSVEATLVEQSAASATEVRSLKSLLELTNKQLEDSAKTVFELRLEISNLEQRCNEETSKTEQVRLESQRNLAEVEKRLTNNEARRLDAEKQLDAATTRLCKLEGEIEALVSDRKRLKEETSKLEDNLMKVENALNAAEASKLENENKVEELKETYQNEIAVLRMEKARLEESLKEAREESDLHSKKIETLNDNIIKLSQRNVFLERSAAGDEGMVMEAGGQSASALGNIIKYLQDENRQSMERILTAELQWKRLRAQVTDYEERQARLEEELKKCHADAEAGVRALAEKSEMVSRLSLLEGVQRENEALKKAVEKTTAREELLSKKLSELESQAQASNSEKIGLKSRIQNLTIDLQNCRKEADSWKERHAETMSAFSKIGPEKVVSLTSEIESLKRQTATMGVELENGKRQAEETSEKHKVELGKLTVTVNQLRSLAKGYKAKYIALNEQVKTGKGSADVKNFPEASPEKSESSNEGESTQIGNLKQQLLATRLENEKLKQQLGSLTPRTGWPVETMSSTSSPSKGPSVLQAQMKQIESLNSLNKDLKSQLENLAGRYKDTQEELASSRRNCEESQAQMEALRIEKEIKEEELRFRLNSITSMMKKKDEEIPRLRSTIESLEKEAIILKEKISCLETTLQSYRMAETSSSRVEQGSETTSLSELVPGISATPVIKPVSSSTSVISQCGSDLPFQSASPTRGLGQPTAIKPQFFLEHGKEANTVAASEESSISVGESAVTITRDDEHNSTSASSSKRPAVPPDPTMHPAKHASVSTTSEQPTSVASSSGKASDGASDSATVFAIPKSESTAGQAKSPFAAFTGFPTYATGKSSFGSGSSTFAGAQQSNAVSQSSGTNFSATGNSPQTNKPAQQNVISGSGDGMNVISSSGASSLTDVAAGLSSSTIPGSSGLSSAVRKRQVPFASDQSSSMESGSDLQETVKRQRVSPSEQVSTSSRFMQQTGDARQHEEKGTTVDEDGADPEQQENVETTTNPEDEGVGEDFLEEERNAIQQQESVKEDQSHAAEIDSERMGEEGEEEGYQEEMEGEAGDEEAPEDDERVREEEYFDETVGEGGEEEYEDEMEEDEDYEDEEDYEGVEEEVPDINSRRPTLIAPRSNRQPQSQPVDDEEVIVIEDDEEEDEVSHSQSPADQSTDEADEGPRASVYRPDTSNEQNGAERENENGSSHDNPEGSDHLDLQQPLRGSDASHSVANAKSVEAGSGDSEVSSVPSGEMELSHADTTAHSAGGAETSLVMRPSATRDSSPYVVNIESDSRGASSTVAPTIATKEKEGGSGVSPHLLEEDEAGNEVAEEEQGLKMEQGVRTAQTDDEAGVSEPSTSVDSRQRRTRILYPDVDEPSSSSVDRARGAPPTLRGRGVSIYRARRSQTRKRP